MKNILCVSLLMSATLLSANLAQAGVIRGNDGSAQEMVPTGKGWGEIPAGQAAKGAAKPSSGSNGIFYHNGPVLTAPTNIYYIWYGNWSSNSATSILTDLASSIGNSPYYNINGTYYNASKTPVSTTVIYSGAAYDNYSFGTALSDANVQSIVANAINSGS